MQETNELIFKSMREASKYFNFPYSGKMPERNNKYLSCYCDWERISRKFIKVNNIYVVPKKFERQSIKEYKYQVGDIISSTNSSVKVLKQIRCAREKMSKGKKEIIYEKGYLVKCIKDGYEFEMIEYTIPRNYGCPVCGNRRIVKGINDVATTHPDIAKLFDNIEDAYTTSYSTAKKFKFRCPKCGSVKWDDTNNISTNGFSCPHCSDGISYPNKFMAKLLTDLNIDFDREVRFDWCKYPCFINNNKLDYGSYDFVIPKLNLIIEMDGGLGHGKHVMNIIRHNRRKVSAEETIYRDAMKDKLAKENGYGIIRIDCDYTNIEDRFLIVKHNILQSELSSIFNFNKINFDKIDLFCLNNSYAIDVTNLWNSGFSVSQIEKEMKLSQVTIGRYLNMCSKIGLCDYNKDESLNRGRTKSNQRAPYLIRYDGKTEVFSSFVEMKRFYLENYNIKIIRETMIRHINNNKKYYNKEFTKLTKEEFNKYYNDKSLADLIIGEAFLVA